VTAGTVAAREVEAQTACLVYAVVRADDHGTAASMTGVDGQALRSVVHGPVAAIVNDIAVDRPPGRRADLMAYSDVLDDLLGRGVVVPVQFGSILPDEETVVEEFLAPNVGYFVELLDQLDGRAQFNVRATYVEDVILAEIVASDPEVADLRDRTRHLPEEAAYADRVRLGELVSQAVDVRREFDAQILADAIVPLTAAHHLRLGTGLETVADFIVLVDDDRRPEFEQRLEDLAEAVHERIRLRLVGPVAPFDFVGDV
jgi:hypothetical protein